MNRPVLFALFSLAVSASSALAGVIEVPLPSLLGAYPAAGGRVATIHFATPPAVVHGAWLRIRGTEQNGTATCRDFLTTSPVSVAFSSEIYEAPAYWLADGPTATADGAFEWTSPFALWAFGGGSAFGFLDDGDATIAFGGGPPGMLLECSVDPPGPTATVTEATFLLDADFPTPAGIASWGRVKAIYR